MRTDKCRPCGLVIIKNWPVTCGDVIGQMLREDLSRQQARPNSIRSSAQGNPMYRRSDMVRAYDNPGKQAS